MEDLQSIMLLAITIGFLHTLFGPDHYLPFVMMSQARNWSKTKTFVITMLCGIGHVGGTVLLGVIGVAAGIFVFHLEEIESVRGDIAAWSLVAFGIGYVIWSLWKIHKNKQHSHSHHGIHKEGHLHIDQDEKKQSITPWILFVIFVLGPCEPLIPVLMYPAVNIDVMGMVAVVLIYAVTTVGTMVTLVMLATYGIRFLVVKPIEKYMHVIAGVTIFLCGFAIIFLGL